MDATGKEGRDNSEIASFVIIGAALFLALRLHLLPALIGGLLVYELVHVAAPWLRVTRLSGTRARLAVVSLLAISIVLLLTLGTWGLISFFRSDAGSVPALLERMASIIEESRDTLPGWLASYIPSDTEAVKSGLGHWLRSHAGELEVVGREAGRTLGHVLVGMVIGALVSLGEAVPAHEHRPLSRALTARTSRLGESFHAVVFAQVRIAAMNTAFAWLYLEVVLPSFGVHLPLVKTMVAVTFVTGLLPIVGNLLSNSVVIVVSLSHSLSVALTSLVFLVVIHKLEYFLNARIVGTSIRAHAWEILLAMLVAEAAFGIAGLIAAPIYYAYLKRELTDLGLI